MSIVYTYWPGKIRYRLYKKESRQYCTGDVIDVGEEDVEVAEVVLVLVVVEVDNDLERWA